MPVDLQDELALQRIQGRPGIKMGDKLYCGASAGTVV